MNRRRLVGLGSMLLAWPALVRAQQPKKLAPTG